MRFFLLIAALVVVARPALAVTAAKFPTAPVKNIQSDTKVVHPSFSVIVPKGWSYNPEGANEKFSGGLTITPTVDLAMSDTYVGVHVLKSPQQITLEQRKARFDKDGRPATFVTWQGKRWLLNEGKMDSDSGKLIHTWAAFSEPLKSGFVVIAGTPEADLAKYRASLFKVMETISISTGP